jgi:hypothetical protein
MDRWVFMKTVEGKDAQTNLPLPKARFAIVHEGQEEEASSIRKAFSASADVKLNGGFMDLSLKQIEANIKKLEGREGHEETIKALQTAQGVLDPVKEFKNDPRINTRTLSGGLN